MELPLWLWLTEGLSQAITTAQAKAREPAEGLQGSTLCKGNQGEWSTSVTKNNLQYSHRAGKMRAQIRLSCTGC